MAWYNSNWSKRKCITLTGGSSGMQSAYQLKLTISHESAMQADFDDLRFTKSDGTTALDAWLEEKTDSTSAKIWVETDTPANGSTADIYMYYGNSGAASDWDIGATFPDLSDDFEDNDVTDWSGSTMAVESTTVKAGTYSGVATGSGGPYKTGNTKSTDYTIEFDFRTTDISNTGFIAVGSNGVFADHCTFLKVSSGYLQYYDGSYHTLRTISANTWYKFILTIHFSTNTFDIKVDGTSEGTGCGTRGTITSNNDFDPMTNDRTQYYDNIFSRKYASSPATYSIGSEEPPSGHPTMRRWSGVPHMVSGTGRRSW